MLVNTAAARDAMLGDGKRRQSASLPVGSAHGSQ